MQWRQETFDSCMATIQKLHDQTVSSGIQHALAEATIARLMVGDLSETVREVFLLAFLEWQMEQESEEVAATKSEESQLRETVKRVAQAVETGSGGVETDGDDASGAESSAARGDEGRESAAGAAVGEGGERAAGDAAAGV